VKPSRPSHDNEGTGGTGADDGTGADGGVATDGAGVIDPAASLGTTVHMNNMVAGVIGAQIATRLIGRKDDFKGADPNVSDDDDDKKNEQKDGENGDKSNEAGAQASDSAVTPEKTPPQDAGAEAPVAALAPVPAAIAKQGRLISSKSRGALREASFRVTADSGIPVDDTTTSFYAHDDVAPASYAQPTDQEGVKEMLKTMVRNYIKIRNA
jgi:hypothetical protein